MALRGTLDRFAALAPNPTPQEHRDRGRQARIAVPRAAHSGFKPQAGRRDPISVLVEQATTRDPQLIPIRYGRMVESPFSFFRGAAAIMAGDLATSPHTGLLVQTCGDAHLMNFGSFFSPERELVFDINDFDETLPAVWEWDVKRLAASLVVAGRDNGYSRADNDAVVLAAVGAYRRGMHEFAGMKHLQLWYSRLNVDELIDRFSHVSSKTEMRRARSHRNKAIRRDSMQAFSKLTVLEDGVPKFDHRPPLLVPLQNALDPERAAALGLNAREALAEYWDSLPTDMRLLVGQFHSVDIAHKVVGVGSVGTRAWVVLLQGRDSHDPLLIQVKEAQPSVLEPYFGASPYANAGERVVAGQRLIQTSSDIFLGWTKVRGFDDEYRDFYVRQLRDGKGSFDVGAMTPAQLAVYAEACAWTLARAHARTGDRIAMSTYLGRSDGFDRAIASFAQDYADQTELDHAALREAIDSGRIRAIEGV